MTADEVNNYLNPALVAVFGRATIVAAEQLEALLDTKEYTIGYQEAFNTNDFRPMSVELRDQLIAIANAGDHAKTIIKIIRIRKGLEP